MQNINMSTQWNQKLSKYTFSKVMKYLEQKSLKQIDCKRPSSAKQMNRVQNIRILAVFDSTCLH